MRFRAGLLAIGFLLNGAVLSVHAQTGSGGDLDAARAQYEEALEAISRARWADYDRLRPGLDDYPLAIYLDYYRLTGQGEPARPADALRFLRRSAGSPLPDRFTRSYLTRAGQEERWRDFLEVQPVEPGNAELKCYYFRARFATGDAASAWEGARRLWDYGQSRPKACDPLFDAWLASGQLTDDIVWSRQLKAFDERQRSLLVYVGKKAGTELRPWSDRLLAVYDHPDRMRQQALPPDSDYSADIASRGLVLLARYNPQRALEYWHEYRRELEFSEQQVSEVEHAIALQALLARSEELVPWLTAALPRLGDDKLVEIRLRWVLGEQDWDVMAETLPMLSRDAQQADVWRYWNAVTLEQQGDSEGAAALLAAVARERSYHGFLAADRLGSAYAFNQQVPGMDAAVAGQLEQLPVVKRVGELNFHQSYNLAHSEWYYLLQGSDDKSRNEQLAQLAYRQGWYRMAIDAVNRAQAWDALELRFPMPYQDAFRRNAAIQKVPSTELMAIARRESAFYPQAVSPVGARGLMQLMPATGAHVASSLGRRGSSADLFEVEHNVLLGSAYYRQLLDRFDGNRVFALTGYNAGPHRVDRWRHKPGETVPVDVWIDTIPYKETRDYVQNVLFYNVVFQYLLGDTRSLLTDAERAADY